MKNVHMSHIRVIEGKIENLKIEGKTKVSTLNFIYTIHFAYLKGYTMPRWYLPSESEPTRLY